MTSWTTPRTWVTGEVLSSANMNTHVRDNMIHYGGTDAISTTPPASPGDGQRWVLPADTTTGRYWHFVYRTALARWIFVGGSGLWATATAVTATGAAYTALSSAVSVTVPRAGLYRIKLEADLSNVSANPGVATVKLGGAAASDADSPIPEGTAFFTGDRGFARTIERTLAASDVVAVNGKANGAVTATFNHVELNVEPVYVT